VKVWELQSLETLGTCPGMYRNALLLPFNLYRKAVLFYCSYTTYKGRIIYLLKINCTWRKYYLFTAADLYYYLLNEAPLYMIIVSFIYWGYIVYEGNIIYWMKQHCIWRPVIYLLQIPRIWRQFYSLTEAILDMKAVLFIYCSYTVYEGSIIY